MSRSAEQRTLSLFTRKTDQEDPSRAGTKPIDGPVRRAKKKVTWSKKMEVWTSSLDEKIVGHVTFYKAYDKEGAFVGSFERIVDATLAIEARR